MDTFEFAARYKVGRYDIVPFLTATSLSDSIGCLKPLRPRVRDCSPRRVCHQPAQRSFL